MRFDILTLFPDMIEAVLGDSIIGRAREKNLLEINMINIRDFSNNKHRKTDAYPYSGGGGMIMTPQPIYDAYMSVAEGLSYKPYTVYMSPQGAPFNQGIAKELLQKEHIVLLCGHYEGIDQRVIDEIVDSEISMGDFVLTGGEIPAAAMVDSVVRLLPGVLGGGAEATARESFCADGLLEAPQYTRPPVYRGLQVPEVLLNGDHAKTEGWRRRQAFDLTKRNRPDLISMGGTYAVSP